MRLNIAASRLSRLVVVGAFVTTAAYARGQDAGTLQPMADAAAAPTDTRSEALDALTHGELSVDVSAQDLFDVPLDDEQALQIERVRLGSFLAAFQGDPDAGGAQALAPPSHDLDPARWRERLALDRARLAFYELPLARRRELLARHAARRAAARPEEAEVDRATREAELDRARALEAAQSARSEAERLVSEELARLIGLQRALTALQQSFVAQRRALSTRVDGVLGWQRRVRDAKTAGGEPPDVLYDALRRTLRASRDELALALDALASGHSVVPSPGPDALQRIPPELRSAAALERRKTVQSLSARVRALEQSLREHRAATLLDETNALNHERLGLLAHLSPSKRSAIIGFTAAGLDQAHSEARQLLLILRYHRDVAQRWLHWARGRQGLDEVSVWRVALALLPWLLLLAAFSWWRGRSRAFLEFVEQRVAERDRQQRRTTRSSARKVVRFASGLQRPLGYLMLFALGLWLLPQGAQALLEVQLLTAIVGWSLTASLIVEAIDALAAITQPESGRVKEDTGDLRLRSLRLVGRVVVVFALVLWLSARLVGEGTVYNWVLSTCWLAALPLFLLLVRWWRETVFVRIERVRRPSGLQRWILANREGWKSFFAAMIAAVQLFVAGIYRTGRSWLSGFTLTRRADAYLFKRELDRLAGGKTAGLAPLSALQLESLSPERTGGTWVSCPADRTLVALSKHIASGAAGVVAVIGPRGMGKTRLLHRLHQQHTTGESMSCDDAPRADALHERLRVASGARPWLSLDDAQSLIKPVLGGLRPFDDLLALARAPGSRAMWVLALDAALWPYLRRARDDRPLFDAVYELEPWTDEQIGSLLAGRSGEAGFVPSFEDLLDKLPARADEIERQEALAVKRVGYMRVVWDYARGNPAIALEVWRSSLVADAAGGVRARPLQVPPVAALEQLPDSTLFILRAVLQMAPASSADVALATRLPEPQVRNAFEFGAQQGYLTEECGRVRVTWHWLRVILLLLERRHLVVQQ